MRAVLQRPIQNQFATTFSLQIGLTKGQIYTPYQMNLAVYLVKWKI